MRTFLVLAACGALAACSTTSGPPTLDKARSAIMYARGVHGAACTEVKRLHEEGSLTGPSFNTARQSCITADSVLDAADVAYAAGRLSDVTSGTGRALVLIGAAQAVLATISKE